MPSRLFSSFTLRDLTIRNRIFVSPMCQYSAADGLADDWHMVHLGARAVGGAGLVMTEATAVNPEGRISPYDLGLWNDSQCTAFQPIAAFIKRQGAVPGIQLAHAGRKASTDRPWHGGTPLDEQAGGWSPRAPSALPFSPQHALPHAMTAADIEQVVDDFVSAAKRSVQAGFEVLELHMAHGYLLHEFLSPLSNQREDAYGGDLEHRARLPLHVARAVRAVWPQRWPLFVRISATDWVEGGWDLDQSIQLAKWLRESGVDLIDCSSGGLVPEAVIPAGPGYQTPFAAAIRRQARIATGAVGLITAAEQAEQIVATGMADCVFLAREMLRDPYWPLHAAERLRAKISWPPQYQRAMPH